MANGAKLVSLSAIVSMALMSACTSNEGLNSQSAVNDPTNKIIESSLMSDYEVIKTVSSQIDRNNIYDNSMQPVNKTEKCLIPFMVADAADSRMYWDGKCSNGHAVGLGRAVRTIADKKVAEYLIEIDEKNPDTLHTYLRYDAGRFDSEIGYSVLTLKDNKFTGFSATMGYNDQDWLDGVYEFTYRYEDTANFVSYTKIIDLLSGEYSSIIAYPNFSHDLFNASDNVLSSISKTYRLLEGRTMIGLSYIWLKDGRLLMKDNATGSDSILTEHPAELETMVNEIQDKVAAQTDIVSKEVEKGFAKVEEYSSKQCKRPNAFFKGDEVNVVCDYLFNLNAAYDQLVEAKEVRSHEIDSFRDSQNQRLQKLNDYLKNFKKLGSPEDKN